LSSPHNKKHSMCICIFTGLVFVRTTVVRVLAYRSYRWQNHCRKNISEYDPGGLHKLLRLQSKPRKKWFAQWLRTFRSAHSVFTSFLRDVPLLNIQYRLVSGRVMLKRDDEHVWRYLHVILRSITDRNCYKYKRPVIR